MKLQNEIELENTRRKLAELQAMISTKENSPTRGPAYEISLESMRALAQKLEAEIAEYQRAHQPA